MRKQPRDAISHPIPQVLHGGEIGEAARHLGCKPEEIVDFSANVNPLGPPSSVKALLEDSETLLALTRRYPDNRSLSLREAMAIHWRVPLERVAAGNGATELLRLAMESMRPTRVLIAAPTYGEYRRVAAIAGARTRMCAYPDWQEARDMFPSADLSIRKWRPDLFALCLPNNPTGTLPSWDAVGRLCRRVASVGGVSLIDASFIDFVENGWRSLRRVVPKKDLILRSLTKFYALPGLRLGGLVGPRPLVTSILARQDPWSVNGIAQEAGCRALKDKAFSPATRAWLSKERDHFMTTLGVIPGMEVHPSAANFLLLRFLKGAVAAQKVSQSLLKQKILARACGDFGLSDCLRIAVRTRHDNDRLVQTLLEKRAWHTC